MARACVAAACGVATLTIAWLIAGPGSPATIRGFSVAGSAAEMAREREFMTMPSSKANEADFDVMTAEPHHIGSPYEIELADYVAEKFANAGLDVSRYEYSVLVPWPGERHIDIVEPNHVTLHVEEEIIRGDSWATKPGILPAYNAYSPSGDVTGHVVYVNFGTPADYDTLRGLGIDVRGKIVLARYGDSWRGIKPKVAAEHGAIGCLIYADPHEDGYFRGEVYPEGALRGWGMIQRGSVLDVPRYPGDPATPGRPSKPGIERLSIDQINVLPTIPVQPMSYRDALEILKRLQGPVAPKEWRGALPVVYHVGPGPAKVHLSLKMEYAQRRLINVIGKVTGVEWPDKWVIVGSHRDAWTFGASDSVSGHVSMMAVAQALGSMVEKGWKPRRSILFASWDGEEAGLLGSTEWVEELGAELKAKAVVYVNRDAGASGPYFAASAVHSLAPFIRELAQSIRSDDPSKTLYDRWLEWSREDGPRDKALLLKAPKVGALGSGSDYTPFLQHIGVSSLDIGVNGRLSDGAYHSTYDNPAWFKKFIDPEFRYSVLASQLTGVAVLRLADAELLPFDYEFYGKQIGEYIDEIQTETTNNSPGDAKKIDFGGLRSAAAALAKAGADLRRRGESALDGTPNPATLAALNLRIVQAERDLIEPSGLPDRPWYKHMVYAPGLYTGYAVKTIPGVREAVEAGNYTRAAEQARIVIRALEHATRTLQGN